MAGQVKGLFTGSIGRLRCRPLETRLPCSQCGRAGPLALRRDRESSHCCTHMATTDLSDRILAALTEALSGAGFRLVTQVEVRKGWGDVYIVAVHTGLSRGRCITCLPESDR